MEIESLVPEGLRASVEGGGSGDEFVERLGAYDAEFEALRGKAEERGEVLRYVGVIDVEGGVIKAALQP